MQFTRTVSLRLLKIAAIAAIAIVIIAYAAWRSLNYVRGPQIDVFQPANGSTVSSSSESVSGRVERAANLTLDGRQILVDQQGNFNETVVIFPGLNILTLSATDQFGRIADTRLQLVGSGRLSFPVSTSTAD